MTVSICRWKVAKLAFPLFALGLLTGCETSPVAPAKKPISVEVTTPITGEVTDYQDFTGRLDAIKTVDIRARVSGFVMSAPFKEGDIVHEGDLLFQIDERTYKATFNQTDANVKVAVADRQLQERNSYRAKRLIVGNSMAQEDYDTTLATYEKSKASVGSMEATRDMAKLYLDFTRVTAPLSGRISRRLVDPGNLVTADQTILTTIVSDQQLYAYFDVDERTYLDLMEAVSPGQASWMEGLHFPVLLRLANEGKFARAGVVDFIDNRVNATTGTIRMRGVFDNANGLLKPGLFVRIRLPIGKPYQTILVPDVALISDQDRKYIYVVNDKNIVEYRAVTLGQEIDGLRAVKEGLALNEQVIINGQQRVRTKAHVDEIIKKAPPKRPESQLGKLLNAVAPLARTEPHKSDKIGGSAIKEIRKAGSDRSGG